MLKYILLISCLTTPLWGALKIEIASEQQVYTLDDTISVSVTVESTGSKLVQLKRLPRPKGLKLIGKSKSFSQNYSFSSGRSQARLVLTYNLSYLPQKVGRIRFRPVKLRYKGKLYTSNSFSINVVKSDVSAFQNGQKDIFAWPFDRDLFLVAKVDKSTVYVGEQIVVKYYLYYRAEVDFAEQPVLPSFKDVWIEEFDKLTRQWRKRVSYKRYYFNVQLLNQVALFPMKAGELILPPFQGKFKANIFTILNPRNSNMIYRRKSNYLKIHVKPLPDRDKPISFRNENVGRYHFSIALSKDKATVNEPVTLTMKIRGRGNIRNISFPELPKELEGFKIYEPVEKTEVVYQGEKVAGEKTLTVAIKPLKPGKHKPFQFKFSFFDPKKGRYEMIDYSDLKLEVTGTAAEATPSQNIKKGDSQTDQNHKIGVVLKPLQEQLHYNHRTPKGLIYLFWFLLIALPFGYLMLMILFKRKAHLVANQSEILSRQALKQSILLLKNLKGADFPQQEHYQKIYQVIVNYINHRFSISIKGLTGDQIILFFKRKGIQEQYGDALVKEIENSEFLRFSNAQISQEDQQKSVDEVIEILKNIDQEGV